MNSIEMRQSLGLSPRAACGCWVVTEPYIHVTNTYVWTWESTSCPAIERVDCDLCQQYGSCDGGLSSCYSMAMQKHDNNVLKELGYTVSRDEYDYD